MAIQGFTARFAHSVRKARLLTTSEVIARARIAGESDPLPASDAPNDLPIPVEHTSPEDVSPAKPEDGKDTFEHEVKRIDPNHFEAVERGATAGLADELAQAGNDPSPAPAAPEPSEVATPPEGVMPDAQPQPAPEQGAGSEQGSGDGIFDWVNGLDPVARGRLVNDWQQTVDPKLFSRHTNVLKMEAQGDVLTLTVQAFNTDTGAKPDISTGYSADGVERGELMMHLREVFQPNGPAVKHVLGVYNGFFEEQADLGEMPLLRVKVSGSAFKFEPKTRVIEGWADAGLGADPQWEKTPYSVYLVHFSLNFTTIGGAGANPTPAPAAPAAPAAPTTPAAPAAPPQKPPAPGQGAV